MPEDVMPVNVDASPNFTDDWFGWTKDKFSKAADFITGQARDFSDFTSGTSKHLENIIGVSETLQGAANVVEGDTGGQFTDEATRRKLADFRERARRLNARLELLKQIVDLQKSVDNNTRGQQQTGASNNSTPSQPSVRSTVGQENQTLRSTQTRWKEVK